jgi:hypothetical protein
MSGIDQTKAVGLIRRRTVLQRSIHPLHEQFGIRRHRRRCIGQVIGRSGGTGRVTRLLPGLPIGSNQRIDTSAQTRSFASQPAGHLTYGLCTRLSRSGPFTLYGSRTGLQPHSQIPYDDGRSVRWYGPKGPVLDGQARGLVRGSGR